MAKSSEPFWWALFGAGGTLSAMFMPIVAILLLVGVPLGLFISPSYEELSALVSHPISKLFLFALVSTSLFHWAHRFRFTLYDGLQIKHLNALIAIMTYGAAIIGSGFIGYFMITL